MRLLCINLRRIRDEDSNLFSMSNTGFNDDKGHYTMAYMVQTGEISNWSEIVCLKLLCMGFRK